MGRFLIFLGVIALIAGVLIGVIAPFTGSFGFQGFTDAINRATNNSETAASLCEEGERLEEERGASEYTQGQGFAASIRYFCVDADGTRREVTGEFVQTLFGGIAEGLPGLIGGIGLSALLSICGTGLLAIGIVMTIIRSAQRRQTAASAVDPFGVPMDVNSMMGGKVRVNRSPQVFTLNQSGGSPNDLTAQLQQLETALERKLITQDEYDRLRKALLDRLGK